MRVSAEFSELFVKAAQFNQRKFYCSPEKVLIRTNDVLMWYHDIRKTELFDMKSDLKDKSS